MTCPVASFTIDGLALPMVAAPSTRAKSSVSTRRAPLAMTSSGPPSQSKTRLLAMAPTAQPSCWAAATAVLASASRIRIGAWMPAARIASATRELRSFTTVNRPAIIDAEFFSRGESG